MRREQVTVVVATVTLAILSVLCPPWRCMPEYDSIARFAGYHFVFARPSPEALRARIFGAGYRATEAMLVYVDEPLMEVQFWWMAPSAVGVLMILEYGQRRLVALFGVVLVVCSTAPLVIKFLVDVL